MYEDQSPAALGIPRHDEPLNRFVLPPVPKRDWWLAWARRMLADVTCHDDATLIRACKVIEANTYGGDPTATALRVHLERYSARTKGVAHA